MFGELSFLTDLPKNQQFSKFYIAIALEMR